MPTAGAPFSGEVIVRRRRFASEETGFAVLDCTAEDSRVILVGPIAHLEEDERARVRCAAGFGARPPIGESRLKRARPV